MNPKKLHILVGLPRSGKSTYAKEKIKNVPIVNPDSVRLALHGHDFIPLAEPMVWASVKLMIRALFIAGHDEVILDATNITTQRRDEFKSKDWIRVFHVLKTPPIACIERAIETNKPNLICVIEKMVEQYQPITIDELLIGEQVWEEFDYGLEYGHQRGMRCILVNNPEENHGGS